MFIHSTATCVTLIGTSFGFYPVIVATLDGVLVVDWTLLVVPTIGALPCGQSQEYGRIARVEEVEPIS